MVLVKLIMDLYLKAGPRASFPLVLMLLQARVAGSKAEPPPVSRVLPHCVPEQGQPGGSMAEAGS